MRKGNPLQRRGLGVASRVHEKFVFAVAGEEAGAEEHETALCAYRMWRNSEVGALGNGVRGFGADHREEGHIRRIGDPERDRHGMATLPFRCGRGLVAVVGDARRLVDAKFGDVRVLAEENRGRPAAPIGRVAGELKEPMDLDAIRVRF
ncbi:hypothetical protein SEVIR_5G270766v4 [Setaria viridis]